MPKTPLPDRTPKTLGALLTLALDDRPELRDDSPDSELDEAIKSNTAEALQKMIEKRADGFKKFRDEGKNIRGVLKPIAAFILFFAEVGAEGVGIVNPAAKGAVLGTAGLLKMANKVTLLYDTIAFELEKIGDALRRFVTHLRPATVMSDELREILVRSLIVMLELIKLVTEQCILVVREYDASSPFTRALQAFGQRAKDFGKVIIDNGDVLEKARVLERLSLTEYQQTAADTYATVREVRAEMRELAESRLDDEFKKHFPLGNADDLHKRLSAERQGHTCEWIIEGGGFSRWKESENSVYVILGPASCGKTTVCTFIINHLRARVGAQDPEKLSTCTLAYFYFRVATSTDEQNDDIALVDSLIHQLARASPYGWRRLRERFPIISTPTAVQRFNILHEMLQTPGPTYIVVDALDECYPKQLHSSGTQGRMLKFLRDLHDLKLPNLHLLVTSRPESSITQSLRELHPNPVPVVLTETHGHQEDIVTFVASNLPKEKPWNDEMRKRAINELTDSQKSQGMFLWVKLQVKHLDHLRTLEEIDAALDVLPFGLEETYRDILLRYGPPPRYVRPILGFIAFARRPLTVAEVVAILSFNFDTVSATSLELEDPEAFIIRILPGVIDIVDYEKTRIVKFIHLSVKEYLTSGILHHDKVRAYHLDRYFADISIAILSLAAFEPGHTSTLGSLKKYAKDNWHEHIPPDVKDGAIKSNSSGEHNAAERGEAVARLNSALSAFLNPDSLAFESWRATNYSDSDTPLHCAARFGLLGQVKRLLEQGADCNAFSEGYTPLYTSVACSGGSYACMEALLERGADPSNTYHDGSTPIHVAVLFNNGDAYSKARRLLEGGASVHLRTTLQFAGRLIGVTPLHIAVQKRDAGSCELLLEQEGSGGLGAIPDWMGQTPLHYAAQKNEPRVLTSLLEGGSSAHITNACGNTPLSLAAEIGAHECVKLLEEHMKRNTPSSESPYDHSAIQGPLSSKPTSDLTLHASLKLSNRASSADESKQRTIIEYLVNMGWSSDLQSVHNTCMLSITLPNDDDGSDSVRCAAKLSGVNEDGRLWGIIPSARSEDQKFSLSHKIQVDCYKETAADTSRVENVQQHAAQGAVPRLLVHFVPAPDELAFHSPMSFPVPPELIKRWSSGASLDFIYTSAQDTFVLEQLVIAALHFRSCDQHNVEKLNSDMLESDLPVDVVAPTSSSDAEVAELEQDSPTLFPSSVDKTEMPQISPLASSPVAGERASSDPIEGAVAPPPALSTSILLLCGIAVTAAVVYVGVVHSRH